MFVYFKKSLIVADMGTNFRVLIGTQGADEMAGLSPRHGVWATESGR